jgi:flavin reductase (DIM6/NTAB) family NADH-FMN oxidoreductase RutF
MILDTRVKEKNNEKIEFKPGTMVYPVPAVMVSCGNTEEEHNIITIAWTGIINYEPPMTYISVRKSRYSHSILEKNKEFVINLSTDELAFATDYCGVKSGSKINKFKEMKLTKIPATKLNTVMIAEAPVNVECKIFDVIVLPSHDMFLAEIVAVNVNKSLMNNKGKLELEKLNLLAYSHGEYVKTGKSLGRFGFSVMKAKTKKRLSKNK